MVKAALVGLLTALLAISSGNLAAAQSTSVLATVAPAGSKVKAATTPAVVPKAAKATTTSTATGTKDTTAATTTAAAKTDTTAAKTTKTTADTTKAATAPAGKALSKSTRITPSSAAAVTPVPSTKKLDKAKPVRDPLVDTTPEDDTTTATTTKKALTKSKSTGATDNAAVTPKKSLKKSSSTNTRVVVRQQPSNGLPNWVGPRVNAPTGKACYRKTHRASAKCATGYALDKFKTACWAECPLEYPIQCGMECIPQSKDCTKEIIAKILPVANAALSTASLGVFKQITTAAKGVGVALRCGKQLYDIVGKAVEYINDYEENKPETTKQAMYMALKKSDIVAIDLPLGITTCLGFPVADAFSTAKDIANPIKAIVEKIVDSVVTMKNKALEPKQFVNITSSAGVKAVASMEETDVSKLDKVMTCGGELKTIVDKVKGKVQELKDQTPTAPLDAIRFALSSSELILVDIPQATKDCVPKGTKDFYEVREQVRKAFQVIVDKVVDSSSEASSTAKDAPLKPRSKRDFALKVAGLGLDVIAMFEPTGFAALAREYIQKICGPTEFFGEIDDGELKDSLGLNIIGKAFETSNGAYRKKGDGLVKINFISSDTKDVDVNIYSAGVSIANVTLQTDKVVTWTKPMKDLQDKTLYLDRWRPGLFTLPGKGGGSLVMWIPHSSEGGHVELHAVLNKS